MARRTPWPRQVPVAPQIPPRPRHPHEVVVTFVGHATFLIQTPGANVLTDPVFSERASPVQFAGPRRARRPGVELNDLPQIDIVLVSHNHYDHCDLGSLKTLQARFNPHFISLLGNARLLKSAGIQDVEELDWWQDASAGRLRITGIPAQHFAARTPFDRNRALWGGFIIWVADRRLFFAGDTGYGSHFQEIRSAYGPMHLAFLPIGAYEPRWFMKDIHMDPAEAVLAHLDLEAAQSIPMHYGTFQLTPEGIDAPLIALNAALGAKGVAPERFRRLEFGESMRFKSFLTKGPEPGTH